MPTPKEPRLVEIQVDTQLTETIHQLHDISSRIDERIKSLIEKQNGMSDRMERLATTLSDNATRLAILEKAGIDDVRDDLKVIDKKLAILEKQFNNGIKHDMDDMKTKVRVLELSNEHNSSFRTKGEARLDWWMNVVWKVIWTIAGAFIVYKLGLK